ncbi:MAG: hypothetical protein DRI32_00410 [Chloroflexi bacterium]|nr:MAG: hypothetical protein DRI32_00410 [Chloroflexota bacterium]
MLDKYFAIKQARIRITPGNGQTLCHARAGDILLWTGDVRVVETTRADGSKGKTAWMEVDHTDRWNRTRRGWTYAGWLEKVAPPAPVDPINEVVPILDALRTPDPFDAQQFLVLNDDVAHNLCPHFSAAYVGNDPIVTFLGKAQKYSPANWRAGAIKDVGLGISALEGMIADVYGFETMRFAEALDDPFVGTLVSPGKLLGMLERGWMLIAGVKISGATGKLKSRGVGHWVVLKNISPYGLNEGQVEIYNPFSNDYQILLYSDFIKSMGGWDSLTGLWVKGVARDEETAKPERITTRDDRVIGEFLDAVSAEIAEINRWLGGHDEWIAQERAKLDG